MFLWSLIFGFVLQICIESIFPVNEEVKMCISQAANSIGLKEIPKFKVEMGDEQDWVSKNQVSLLVNRGGMVYTKCFTF